MSRVSKPLPYFFNTGRFQAELKHVLEVVHPGMTFSTFRGHRSLNRIIIKRITKTGRVRFKYLDLTGKETDAPETTSKIKLVRGFPMLDYFVSNGIVPIYDEHHRSIVIDNMQAADRAYTRNLGLRGQQFVGKYFFTNKGLPVQVSRVSTETRMVHTFESGWSGRPLSKTFDLEGRLAQFDPESGVQIVPLDFEKHSERCCGGHKGPMDLVWTRDYSREHAIAECLTDESIDLPQEIVILIISLWHRANKESFEPRFNRDIQYID